MSEQELSTLEKLHSETALMRWSELQRFFAQGKVLHVENSLDLVQVAVWLAEDSASELAPYIESNSITHPSNDLARSWYNNDVELWTVAVAPYVLVQQQAN